MHILFNQNHKYIFPHEIIHKMNLTHHNINGGSVIRKNYSLGKGIKKLSINDDHMHHHKKIKPIKFNF